MDDIENELVYLVNPMPQSLLYYVFNFGAISYEDEKRFIYSIIGQLFLNDEKYLIEITTEAISQCFKYLRITYDYTEVSLRDILRFMKYVEFFKEYFTKKNKYENRNNNEKNNKIRSIICSIYICFYFRLTDERNRAEFEMNLRYILLQLLNNGKIIKEKTKNLFESLKNEDFKKEILSRREEEKYNQFSDFINIEQDFLINQIELEKGIAKNKLLKDNLFLLFISILTKIPLIIIGKPGSSKSLSVKLLIESMNGKNSKNKFFQMFPNVIQTYYQGSYSSQPEDIENLFYIAKTKLEYYKINNEELPISMILFDELGLAEISKNNPLRRLHCELEYTGRNDISFIGISDYSLDITKLKRALVLSLPDLYNHLDELVETTYHIVESISPKLKKDKIFEILSMTYIQYKRILQTIKELNVYIKYINENNNQDNDNSSEVSNSDNEENEDSYIMKRKIMFYEIKREKKFIDLMKKDNKIKIDFHGNRDFYSLIKGIANDLDKIENNNDIEKLQIIINYIERNFGGINYEINIDFNSLPEDIKYDAEEIKIILDCNDNISCKITSIFLFKEIFNLQCDRYGKDYSHLKIDKNKNNNMIKLINDNINSITNNRFLLVEIKPSLSPLIYRSMKLQNPSRKIILYQGSPFIDDNNKEYISKKINEFIDNIKDDKIIILENFDKIHQLLFDLYNMNYLIKDGKRYARILLDDFNELYINVPEKLRVIIFTDRRFMDENDLVFLNKFEKISLSFGELLDNKLKIISQKIIDAINLKHYIQNSLDNNNHLRDLLINYEDEDIYGLIYYYNQELKEKNNESSIDENKLKEIVINKIYKILPQDLLSILPDNNIIKNKYLTSKKIFNIKDYINDKENLKFKISIIYTFTSITDNIKGLDKKMDFLISKVKSENELKNIIKELKIKNGYNKIENKNYICIHFERANLIYLNFICKYILQNYENDEYNYIIIIHINRNDINKKERIYSLLYIDPNINQIFIDNLNGKKNV